MLCRPQRLSIDSRRSQKRLLFDPKGSEQAQPSGDGRDCENVQEHSAAQAKDVQFDNGSEFYHFLRLERELGVTVYYADPYNSGQRGTNENTNGLIRDYFPRQLFYGSISPRDVRQAERSLNERPRLRHGFQTPSQLFG